MNASSFEEVKLCLLGDTGVGKSSIIHRFVYDAFKPTMEATIGAAFFTKSIVLESTTYKYQIWDTAGQEKYRALAPMYYRGAAAAIIVYDMTVECTREAEEMSSRVWERPLRKHEYPELSEYERERERTIAVADLQSFAAVKMWVSELKQHAEPDIVMAIAGNKSDLEEFREIQRKDAMEYAETQNAIFIETSAKTAVNVGSLFVEITRTADVCGHDCLSIVYKKGKQFAARLKVKGRTYASGDSSSASVILHQRNASEDSRANDSCC